MTNAIAWIATTLHIGPCGGLTRHAIRGMAQLAMTNPVTFSLPFLAFHLLPWAAEAGADH